MPGMAGGNINRATCGPVTRRRQRGWRLVLLLAVLACFIGLVLAETWHHHESAAEERSCPLCQAADHQPLDLSPPPPGPAAAVLILLYFLLRWEPRLDVISRGGTPYRSRAPPPAV
jgi:hypothetical protein